MTRTNGPAAQWRVPPKLTVLTCAAAVLVTLWAITSIGDAQRLVIASIGAAGLLALALRDLVAPVRLAADADGLTVVSGYARRVRVPWEDVQVIRVDERRRWGLRSRLLEIDTGDDVHLLSAMDLGADVWDAADELARLRPAA
ncbi:PH domain-containing protein [Actinomadura hibisca]|uniref:PH domain-containing protein n=1 Tax=Actinomadura hibisca TaxID=68565 RepID=UPI001FE0E0D3|nr:PH domain-containing protein [Actinomadura hibisca]